VRTAAAAAISMGLGRRLLERHSARPPLSNAVQVIACSASARSGPPTSGRNRNTCSTGCGPARQRLHSATCKLSRRRRLRGEIPWLCGGLMNASTAASAASCTGMRQWGCAPRLVHACPRVRVPDSANTVTPCPRPSCISWLLRRCSLVEWHRMRALFRARGVQSRHSSLANTSTRPADRELDGGVHTSTATLPVAASWCRVSMAFPAKIASSSPFSLSASQHGAYSPGLFQQIGPRSPLQKLPCVFSSAY